MPELSARHFGAERVGVERSECGAGHCGVDLDGPEGRPLVAVADGTIVRIERSQLGLDTCPAVTSASSTTTARSPRTCTWTMSPRNAVGNRVRAGQYIGTLGATAVYESVPHCHFSLENPESPGPARRHDRHADVDPAPFLVRSTILPKAERRHPVKPAF